MREHALSFFVKIWPHCYRLDVVLGNRIIPLILFLSLQQASYDLVPPASFTSPLPSSPHPCTHGVLLVRKQFNNTFGILIYCLSLFRVSSNIRTGDRVMLIVASQCNWHEIVLC